MKKSTSAEKAVLVCKLANKKLKKKIIFFIGFIFVESIV